MPDKRQRQALKSGLRQLTRIRESIHESVSELPKEPLQNSGEDVLVWIGMGCKATF
jgi:hypothetical protein